MQETDRKDGVGAAAIDASSRTNGVRMRNLAVVRSWQRCQRDLALALFFGGWCLAAPVFAADQTRLPLPTDGAQSAGRNVAALVPWLGLHFGDTGRVDSKVLESKPAFEDRSLSPSNESFRLVSTRPNESYERDGTSDVRRLPSRLPALNSPESTPSPSVRRQQPRHGRIHPPTTPEISPPESIADVTPIGTTPRVHPGVVEQSRGYIDRGILQAERGAVYASRTQFIRVLRLISQSLDAQTGTRRHSIALSRGLTALDEAADFRPSGSRLEADLDLRRLVLAHETTLLHNADFQQLTPLAALQAYHVYAEKQLAIAGGHELPAADALFGLAKLQKHLQVGAVDADHHAGPTAMSLYQAALMIYPKHYMAANELGVLFARFGQYRDAIDVLEFAASTNNAVPETWLNLAKIHARLGEMELAQRAEENWRVAMVAANRPLHAVASSQPRVEWVSPEAFTQPSSPTVTPVAAPTIEVVPAATTPPEASAEFSEASRTAERRGWSFWPFR